jgi:hypothetical protein
VRSSSTLTNPGAWYPKPNRKDEKYDYSQQTVSALCRKAFGHSQDQKSDRRLSRDEYRLGMPLLDAAVAGAVLGFRPSDREMRTQARRCWEIPKPQLNQHLLSEDETVLPWAESAGLPHDVVNRIKESHREMRSLIAKLIGVSFEEDPAEVVEVAGKALCLLAVKLDDLIDGEEMRLLPALRRMVFA